MSKKPDDASDFDPLGRVPMRDRPQETRAFSDSIDDNVELIRELLAGAPPDARKRAARAAAAIEKAFLAQREDARRDPAIALGAAFGVMCLADMIVRPRDQSETPLIHLLS